MISLVVGFAGAVNAQPAGYYNGTAGKKGEELKTALHEIINNHVDFSYSQARYLINYSDADPANPNNVILFYTQRSQKNDTYGTGGDYINREHVWAKSHGNFSGIRPMDGDAHNLRPADASVNESRSNSDFGIVQPNGTQHPEATECWYTSAKWEPGPKTKGQVARILFYMATRYEGTNGEMDLEVVNGFNTYPKPEIGDLATLLEWNRQYPPSDFERRRNERLFAIQQNRNPFVDCPEFADLIWAQAEVKSIQFDAMSMSPLFPKKGEQAQISVEINANEAIQDATLYWGRSFDSESNEAEMSLSGTFYSGALNLSSYQELDTIFYKIVASTASSTNSVYGTYVVPKTIDSSSIRSIASAQGTGAASPIVNSVVTFAGRVVANYDNTVYIQDGTGKYSGMCLFGMLNTGQVGDSVVATGKIVEYSNLTELSEVSYFYNFKNNKNVDPIVITASQLGEAYEGMLVRIRNVKFRDSGVSVPDENKSYTFTDATGSGVVFSRYGSRMVGKKLPKEITDVVGVVSQYQSTYQILPRDMNDFSAGADAEAPQIVSVQLLDKDWVVVTFDEVVEQTSAENIQLYSFSNGIVPLAAYRYEEGNAVVLQVANMKVGTHTLTINGVKDPSGNVMNEVEIEFTSVYSKVENLQQVLAFAPNPFQSHLHIRAEKPLRQIEVYDLSGRSVLRQSNIEETQIELDLSHLTSGVYFLRTTDGMMRKIVKM